MLMNIMKAKADILAISILTDKPVPKWVWLICSYKCQLRRHTNQNSLVIEDHCGDFTINQAQASIFKFIKNDFFN